MSGDVHLLHLYAVNSDKTVYLTTFGTNSHFAQRGPIIESPADVVTFATLLITRRM